MSAAIWNTAGLCFGVVGVALLFFWGPLQPSHEAGVTMVVEDDTPIDGAGKTAAEYDREVEARKKLYERRSRAGLVLLGLGFALQLGGVWLAT